MKTNPLRSKVAIVHVMGKLLGFAVISLQLGEICLAHDPGVGIRLLIPSSTYSDTFTSSLIIHNLTAGHNSIDITACDSSGNPLGTRMNIFLQPLEQFWRGNILKDLGAPLGSFGPIKVESVNNQPLSAVSEVRSSQGFGGFFQGQNINSALSETIILDVVDDGSRGTPNTFRTNLGVNTIGPRPARVTISLYSDSGQRVGEHTTTVAANGLTQLDGIVQRLRVIAAVTRGYLLISSDQPIIAWASKIDNGTDDPSFQVGIEVPASFIASQELDDQQAKGGHGPTVPQVRR